MKININIIKNNSDLCLYLILMVYIFQCIIYILFGSTLWMDEGRNLIRSYWYASSQVQPYSNFDPTWQMPIWFYLNGWWQMLFGIGHISSRSFSSILGFINLLFLYKIVNLFYRNKIYGLLAVSIFVLSPHAVWQFTTSSPHALVSLINLLAFFLIFNLNKYSQWFSSTVLGLFYFLLYFIRPNMIIGIFLMLIFQMLFTSPKKLKYLITTISVFILFSILIINHFPGKFGYYTFQIPFITEMLRNIGLYDDPHYNFLNSVYHSVLGHWGAGADIELLSSKILGLIRAFIACVVIPYPIIIIFTTIALFSNKYKTIHDRSGLIASWFFILMLFGHLIGSISQTTVYAICSYTIYFIIIGCFGSIQGIKVFSKKIYNKQIIVCAIPFLILFQLFSNIRLLLNNSLVSFQPHYLSDVKEVAAMIIPNVPVHEAILPIGGPPFYVTLGSFYAKRLFEPTAINQFESNKEFYNESPSNEELKQLKALGFWSDFHMKQWIENKYNYILLDQGTRAYKYKPLVEKYFTPVIPAVNGCILYKRKY